MSCRQYRAGLMEWGRGASPDADLAAHLEGCPECTEWLEGQMALSTALRQLAAAAPQPPDLEAGLLKEFERRRRPVVRWMPLAAAAAMAASLVVGVVITRRSPVPAPPPPEPVAAAVAPPLPAPKPVMVRKVVRRVRPKAPAAAPQPRPFLPIPYTEPLEPYERASVMRVEIPVAALAAAGFRVMAPDPGAQVEADLLVGQDGRARAVRPVNFASFR